MSEQTTSVQSSRPTSGSFFQRKIGPLPTWGWMAIGLVVVLMYSYYKKSKSNSQTNQSAGGVNSPGGVDASLVPQFINQNYENEEPPTAPNITVNNQVPPPPTVIVPPMKEPPEREPTTISSAPGSYTTGLPGGLNEWTSTGKYSLNTIAKSHGMTAQQLIKVSESAQNNVGLKQYVAKKNFNAPVPAGVELFIPNQNWPIRKGK